MSPPRRSRLRRPSAAVLRLAILAALVVGGIVVAVAVGGPSKGAIEGAVRGTGAAGPIVFVALYVGLTVLLFPGAVLTAASGALFGTALGTVLTVVGATIGAMLAFLIGRRIGRGPVERLAGRRIGGIDRWLERRGFLAVLYLRLVPVVPFNGLNYAAGITGLSRRDYVLGTVIGIVPGSFAYAALGGSFDHPWSATFLVAIGLIVVLAALGPVLNRVLRGRGLPSPSSS